MALLHEALEALGGRLEIPALQLQAAHEPQRVRATFGRIEQAFQFRLRSRRPVEQDQQAIVLVDKTGRVPVPVASLSVLLLGPGSTVTHAAMLALAENGCSAAWVGEGSLRLYATGHGETRRAGNLLAQARAWASREGPSI